MCGMVGLVQALCSRGIGRCGGEEKERKTEPEVDGQSECALEREETVGRTEA